MNWIGISLLALTVVPAVVLALNPYGILERMDAWEREHSERIL